MIWFVFGIAWFFCGFLAYGLYKGMHRNVCDEGMFLYSDINERHAHYHFLAGPLGLLKVIIVSCICSLPWIFGLLMPLGVIGSPNPWGFCLKMPKELCEPRPA